MSVSAKRKNRRSLNSLSDKAYHFLTNLELKPLIEEYHGLVTIDLANSASEEPFLWEKHVKDIRKLINTTKDLKLKALGCIILLESEAVKFKDLATQVNLVLSSLTSSQLEVSSLQEEDRALLSIHGLYLAHLLGRESEFTECNKYLENILLRRGFRYFSKEINTHIFLYYFAQLISEFPYLSFQWKKELCRSLEESPKTASTLALSSKAICMRLLEVKSEGVIDLISDRQDTRGCFPYEEAIALPNADILSTAFAFSALNSKSL